MSDIDKAVAEAVQRRIDEMIDKVFGMTETATEAQPDEPLTLDKLCEAVESFIARVSPPPLRIMPSHHWPKEVDHVDTVRFPAHPFVRWLARWLPITPYVEARYERYRDCDPLHDRERNILYCSHAQADALRRATVS